MSELKDALGRAYRRLTGRTATPELLSTLSAQVSLETGGGQKMYNYNFGGIKGAGPTGATASYMTREVGSSGEVHLQQNFRAYDSLDQGAEDYLSLMHTRFGGAISRAERGDVNGFAHALKQSHYFTAAETDYVAALRNHMGESSATAHKAAGTTLPIPPLSGDGFATSDELSRVVDAIALSSLRIAQPEEDDG